MTSDFQIQIVQSFSSSYLTNISVNKLINNQELASQVSDISQTAGTAYDPAMKIELDIRKKIKIYRY